MIRKAIYTDYNESDLITRGSCWNFHDQETLQFLHNLHPYPAKFIPQIPHKVISEFSKEGDTVYDPFCGCGTTLLESSRLKRNAIGTDNNPVAVLLSKAKTTNYTKKNILEISDFKNSLLTNIKRSKIRPELVTDDPNFYYWYDQNIIDHLSKIKGLIIALPSPIDNLLLSIFSSILIRSSFQDSDTRYTKIDRSVTVDKVNNLFISKISRVLDDLKHPEYKMYGNTSVFQCDARNVSHIKSSSVDLIVTSPPYLNAYDYHKYHRQRLHWLDADIKFVRTTEIGSHDQFTRKKAVADPYFDDMNECFSEWNRVLKPKSKCVIVIGDAIVSKRPIKVADRFITQLIDLDFRIYDRVIRQLKQTSRSFNIKNSRIAFEHVLTMEKK